MATIERTLAGNKEVIERAMVREGESPAKRDAARRGDLAGANDPAAIGKRLRRVNAAELASV